jgi:hypothetical protein
MLDAIPWCRSINGTVISTSQNHERPTKHGIQGVTGTLTAALHKLREIHFGIHTV